MAVEAHPMADERPSRGLLTAAEPLRAGIEFAALGVSAWSLALAPRGDGHVVLVLPGLGASDRSTTVVRAYLRLLGYEALPWELERNVGFTRKWDALEARFINVLEEAHAAGKEVSLVGQSLGGTMALRLNDRYPDRVRRVVTLGSPAAGSIVGVAPMARAAYRGLNGSPRITTIFSRTDGIVPWQLALRTDRDAEAIEVRSSHLGMGVNAGVLYAIADRLAEKGDKKFTAPPLLSAYFP